MATKRYPNPVREGAFLKLTDEQAKRAGVFGQHVETPQRGPAPTDLTNEGGGMVTSETAGAAGAPHPGTPPAEPTPEGALQKGGPTHQARQAAEAEAAAAAAEAESSSEGAPAEGSSDDDDQADEEGEDVDDAEDKKSEAPDDKKRPAPSSTSTRRRRSTAADKKA